jgi:hypothetical protein
MAASARLKLPSHPSRMLGILANGGFIPTEVLNTYVSFDSGLISVIFLRRVIQLRGG